VRALGEQAARGREDLLATLVAFEAEPWSCWRSANSAADDSIAPMRALPLAALLAIALAGCSKTIEPHSVEKGLTSRIARQVGAKVKSVSCPSGKAFKKGVQFDCTITGADGTSGKAHVTETDDNGHYTASAPFIHPREIEQSIKSGIEKQIGGGSVKVTCPEIITASRGGTFDCKAVSGSSKATVKATQTDNQGHITYKLQQ
jgi:hypothetical protein